MAAPFVIVGAGEAGVYAALALRELGYDGELLLVTDESHLPYERPPLSKFDASSRTTSANPVGGTNALTLAKADLLRGAAIAAIAPDRKELMTSSGTTIAYSKLLLATGASARRLTLPGASVGDIRYLRTLDDATYLHSRMTTGSRVVIVGGGLIGLELAASARSCGCDVMVLEAQPGVLRRGVPQPIAEVVAGRHAQEGVRILSSVTIETIRSGLEGSQIALADGRKFAADFVVAGAGSVPNVELAVQAGLDTSDGILVDAAMRTSDPYIYAAGDCCRSPLALYGNRLIRLESWRVAQEQGRAAAAGMLSVNNGDILIPWFWSDHFDLAIQVAGLINMATTSITRSTTSETHLVFGLADNGAIVAAAGVGPGNAVARDIKLAQMMIARRMRPALDDLARPDVTLKSLIASYA